MQIHLLLSEVNAHGGIQRYNRQLVKAARAVARSSGGAIQVYSLNDSPDSDGFRGFGRNYAPFVRSAIGASLRERPEAVIVGHVNFAPLVTALRAACPISRIYVMAHGKEVERRLPLLPLVGVQTATGVLAVSESTRHLMRSVQGVPPGRVHVLHYGFEASGAATPVSDDTRSVADVRLLSVARLSQSDAYKGIDTTIEALALLGDNFPTLRYTVVGEGDDLDRLRALAKDLGVGERVNFTGNVSDCRLAELYRESDVFLLPSTREGLGIVYLEAMAHGKPVIGVRAGGVADVVVHEANGLLVPRRCASSVAQSVARLATDVALRRRLGTWGRDHTVPQFSLDRMASCLGRAILPAPSDILPSIRIPDGEMAR